MSTTIQKVAIAGATGSVGEPVTAALVKAGFEVIALTRDATKATFPTGVKGITVDYDSPESLKTALKGQDALVSTLSGHPTDPQPALFDAAIAVGVKRLIPSEFGSDTISPAARSLPVYKDKVAVQDMLKSRLAENTTTSYTFFQNAAFLDWGIQRGFLINAKEKTATLADGGDVPYTVTPLSMVADGVVGVLKHPAETANKVVRVHGYTVTGKVLLASVQKFAGKDGWTVKETDTEKDLQQSYVILKNDPKNVMAWLLPQIFRAALGKGMDINWEHKNDNELLGIKALTPAQYDQIVKESVEGLN